MASGSILTRSTLHGVVLQELAIQVAPDKSILQPSRPALDATPVEHEQDLRGFGAKGGKVMRPAYSLATGPMQSEPPR
jgi:hypothetical protein